MSGVNDIRSTFLDFFARNDGISGIPPIRLPDIDFGQPLAFYFLVLRPQAKRQKEFQARIGAVKKGDAVVTAGGIVGRVTRVEDLHVEVEIAPNTRVRVVKSTLAEVTNPNAKPAND